MDVTATLGDLANWIGTGKEDVHSNGWGQSDAEQRRKIADSLTPGEVLANLLTMAAEGKIRPLSPANGELLETRPDANSLLTSEDIDIAIKCLRAAINWEAIRLAQEKEKLEAGRYTIEEAAKELAANTGLHVDRWRKTLLTEIKQGKLPLRNPRDFGDLLPYAAPDDHDFLIMCEQATSFDLNNCLESHAEWQVAYRFATANAPAKAKKKRLQTIHPQRVEQFRRVITEMGLDPQGLPAEKHGKPGVRARVARALGIAPTDKNYKSFEHHWDRALKDGAISKKLS
jgi:hypothetical protein